MRTVLLLSCLVRAPGPGDQPIPIRHEFAQVNDIRLHYASAGEGPLVMFLHGFPEFWYAWKDQLAEFGRDHLAVAPDLRGYNLSDKPADLEAYQANRIADDVVALARHLNGGRPFVLVAHDWGGAIAWLVAARHPEVIERLVIINAPHPTVFAKLLEQDPAQQRASQYMLFFRSPGAEAALSARNFEPLLGFFGGLRSAGRFTDADAEAYREAWARPGALTGGLNYYRAARLGPPGAGVADSLSQDLAGPVSIRVPTLVIWGMKDDALLPQNLEGLDRFVAPLTIERIPGGTHWVVHEFPERVNALIRGFLSGR